MARDGFGIRHAGSLWKCHRDHPGRTPRARGSTSERTEEEEGSGGGGEGLVSLARLFFHIILGMKTTPFIEGLQCPESLACMTSFLNLLSVLLTFVRPFPTLPGDVGGEMSSGAPALAAPTDRPAVIPGSTGRPPE